MRRSIQSLTQLENDIDRPALWDSIKSIEEKRIHKIIDRERSVVAYSHLTNTINMYNSLINQLVLITAEGKYILRTQLLMMMTTQR